MPALVVGGVTVSVAPGGAREAVVEIGDRARAFDGTMRSTVRSRKKAWPITTIPMTQGDATTLETALNGTLPVACSGDILGASVNCHPEITGIDYVPIAGSYLVVTSFTLHLV